MANLAKKDRARWCAAQRKRVAKLIDREYAGNVKEAAAATKVRYFPLWRVYSGSMKNQPSIEVAVALWNATPLALPYWLGVSE